MRLGVITPVVTLLPRAHARWEETAGFETVVAIAEAADGLGYDFLTCSEHVAVPTDVAAQRGARYFDPAPTLGFLAARTRAIRLVPFVVVLGYHHPLAVVKRCATLDVVSAGRVVLGAGVGSLREEFELLGAPFDDRGARADDALRAIRAAWGVAEPRYEGRFFAFDGMVVDPVGVQDHLPIWIGGRTARSLRRAVELADGWAPFGLGTTALEETLARARATDAWARRSRPLDLVFQNERPFDPLGEPAVVAERVERFRDLGATALAVRFVHRSPDHYLEQLAAMAELVRTVS